MLRRFHGYEIFNILSLTIFTLNLLEHENETGKSIVFNRY